MKNRFLLAIALFCSLAAFAADCDTRPLYGGLPKITRLSPGDTIVVVTNCGYVVGYSEARRNPLWVAYHLRKLGAPGTKAPNPERSNNFLKDTRTAIQVADGDYTNSGYDRGHMAPSYAMGTRFGKAAQDESFLMSNMCPQLHSLNNG